MKRIMTIILVVLLAFSLSACKAGNDNATEDKNGKTQSEENAATEDGDKIDVEDVIEKAVMEAAASDSFSEAAAAAFMKQVCGVEVSSITPDWEHVIDDSTMKNFGDDPSTAYGHATLCFQKPNGELTKEEYDSWAKKVFAATAAASDDGYNIIGFEFVAEGEDAMGQADIQKILDNSFMPGWSFRKGDMLRSVYIAEEYDMEKESGIGRDLYYNAVFIDMGVGLQKSFEESMEEAEKYFGEHEDEINAFMEGYMD